MAATKSTLSNTYFGSAQVINILILCKLWFIATVAVLLTSFKKWVETHDVSFHLGEVERMQRSVAYNIYSGGGLGIFHIPSRCAALSTKQIVSFSLHRQKLWVHYASYWIDFSLRTYLVNTSLNSSSHARRRDPMSFTNTPCSTFDCSQKREEVSITPPLRKKRIQNIPCLHHNHTQKCQHDQHRLFSSMEETQKQLSLSFA